MKKQNTSKALVLQQVALGKTQAEIINAPTPAEFVKERPIRGGKTARYVEGGYIVAKLNQAFGPLNWSWEVIEHGKEVEELWVRGRLTILDHQKGYKVSKDSFGQHPIHKGVPYGDSLKAASTDALKKAAAQGLGLALDVYWQEMDTETKPAKQTKTMSQAEAFQRAKSLIVGCNEPGTLRQWKDRIEKNATYKKAEKESLTKLIDEKLNRAHT